MVMTATSMKPVAKKEIATGEARLDKEGKGYWHTFSAEELAARAAKEALPEVKTEVKADVKSVVPPDLQEALPEANWTEKQVKAFIKKHDLPIKYDLNHDRKEEKIAEAIRLFKEKHNGN